MDDLSQGRFMQKLSRSITEKPARHVAHNRRPPAPAPPSPASGKAVQPVVTRLVADVDLVAPKGFTASVLLKLVSRDDTQRQYALWALAGRHDVDTCIVPYKYTGEDTIRVDLPEGMPLSAEALAPHLTAFLASEGNEPPGTPIIRG
jgi:hypothetical protein